jgi:serine protease AprX
VNGNVQRLPNGNTLIGWGLISSPSVTEVRPDGTKVYEMGFQPTNASFRAFRFPWPGAEAVSSSPKDESLRLRQSYPNPIGLGSESTTISYSLAKPSMVTLTIHDVLGREVRRVPSDSESAGEHHATVSASELPAGTYFYRLTAGGDSRVGSMVVVR